MLTRSIVEITTTNRAESSTIGLAQHADWHQKEYFFAKQGCNVEDAVFGNRRLSARFGWVNKKFLDRNRNLYRSVAQAASTFALGACLQGTLDHNAAR